MKCSHAKAHHYLANVRPNIPLDMAFEVRCGRCKTWIGKAPQNYKLPSDFKVAHQVQIRYFPKVETKKGRTKK